MMSLQRSRAEAYADLQLWKPPIYHATQQALVDDNVRIKIAAAGRRSGKTYRAMRNLVRAGMLVRGLYFAAAPTLPQAKQIFWRSLCRLSAACTGGWARMRSSGTPTIFLPNGSEIIVVGLDKPARFEGIPWDGGVIDEIANVKPDAWAENIRPALDTWTRERPDYLPWVWLIGVPEGLNHFYDLAVEAQKPSTTDMKFYTWLSADILPPDRIAAAKASMSAWQYRQEYEASFESPHGKVYPDYGKDNFTDRTVEINEPLFWAHDFNFTPMSSAIGHIKGDTVHVLDEIVLESAVARNSAIEFVERYKDHGNKSVILYGDSSGKAGEKHSQVSNYNEIENHLRANNWQTERRIRGANPGIKDRQNALRAKIKTADETISLFVNPDRAKFAHKGLLTLQYKKGSTFQEAETLEQHITTAMGYMVEREWPVSRFDDVPIETDDQPTVSYW